MLDLPRVMGIRLSSPPRGQLAVGRFVLIPNYEVVRRVRIGFDGVERVPQGPVIYAMNHTDRYNYWPFQYRLWRAHGRYTATWVKGKYYENRFMGRFMEWTNNIPAVSRGYLITRDFLATCERRPTDVEYEGLRSLVDEASRDPRAAPRAIEGAPAEIFDRKRSMLGREYDPSRETYPTAVNALFAAMMARFVALNRQAHGELGLDLLVFPQGTRSKRLSRGHIGLAEIALELRASIVPVGCSGSDQLYPGSSPFARGGTVTYRFGAPLRYEDLAAYHVPEGFQPFDAKDEERYRDRFSGLVDLVMNRVNDLVDPEYQFGPAGEGESDPPVQSASHRFV
jgi:1-acyl-sn-glycerol-3-phosphate acyltransferase